MKELTSAQAQRQLLADNLNNLLKQKRKTQADVIRELQLPEATVRSWFSGDKYPRIDKLQILSDYFNVPRSHLTEDPSALASSEPSAVIALPILKSELTEDDLFNPDHLVGFQKEIATYLPAGTLFFFDSYDEAMAPIIPKGARLLCQAQAHVENGDVVLVRVNNKPELHLRQLFIQGDTVILRANNPTFPPIVATTTCSIDMIGKVRRLSYSF